MRSGKLRWRVTVESPVLVRTALGEKNLPTSWTSLGTFWAKIRTATGREIENANQRQAQITHVVTMRYIPSGVSGRPLVTPKMRLNFKGRFFYVVWLNNLDERNRQLDAYCEERVAT